MQTGIKDKIYKVNYPECESAHGLFVLIHDDHVELSNGKDSGPDYSYCRGELLRPERGYSDGCLYWFQKSQLECLTKSEELFISNKVSTADKRRHRNTGSINWRTVEGFEAGSSHKVCQMGGANFPYDQRGYATALAETCAPLLDQWLAGAWTEQTISEYTGFLSTAISRGSFPMLAVAAIGADQNMPLYLKVVADLSEKDQGKLRSLIKIGRGSDEYGKYIKGLAS